MNKPNHDDIRTAVRENYGKVALGPQGEQACGCSSSCCVPNPDFNPVDASKALGYSGEDLASVPDGANMGLGCGNPRAIASLKPGETVLDLGSGGGFDAFLAARAVGENGRVIGVDMTPEMVSKARRNAVEGKYGNVEFRLGEIEHLPVADSTVDIIISNCVINLSPEKEKVFADAYRVLKPGGRIAVSDIVATGEMPEDMRQDLALHTGCIAGASTIESLEHILQRVGFADIRIASKEESREFIRQWAPGTGIEKYVVSAEITAYKPLKK